MSNQYRPTDFELQSWLKAQRTELLALGLPMSILNDGRRWQLFLEDGAYSSSSSDTPDIDVDDLPPTQADLLLRFLVVHFPERGAGGRSPYRAINRLEAILRRGPHAV